MRLSLLLLLPCTFLLTGCGVKQPPIAPRSRPVAVVPGAVLNDHCSPTDEKCDARDPNYKPRGSEKLLQSQ
jgi:hypothetical protein